MFPQSDVATADFEGLPAPSTRTIRSKIVRVEITGASVDALHVRAHRAKALLRKQLGSVVDTFWVERT